jgi:hypothetical protein
MTPTIKYQYADGSGNRYVIASTSVEYVPVTPPGSSSGTYSGGEAKSAAITSEQFDEIGKLFDNGFRNPAAQQDDRAMMTGMITKVNGNDSVSVVLKATSKEKSAVEDLLKRLLGGDQ